MPTIHILSLVVSPNNRRRGIARQLLQAVVRALVADWDTTVSLQTGLKSTLLQTNSALVTLHVASDNEEAQALYERMGLRAAKTVRGYYRRRQDGGTSEAVEMRGVLVV